MAATGKQLKQSVKVFHSRMLYRRLPGERGREKEGEGGGGGGGRGREREKSVVCVLMMSLIAMEEKTQVGSI